jgi:nitrogen regulatory protein P-II 2
MESIKRKLVTIISESSIERRVLDDIRRLKIKGYTIVEARGSGAHGARSDESEHDRNIRIEAICDETVARQLIEHLMKTYYKNYAMITYMTDVEVFRSDKF